MKKAISDEVRLLKATRKLVQKGWTQRLGARDRRGREVSAFSPKAVKWCAVGALYRAAADELKLDVNKVFTNPVTRNAQNLLWNETGRITPGLADYNDLRSTKKGDILKLIDRTIVRMS